MKCKNYNEILKNIKEPIAFVLGCYITGLGVIRNLGRKGIPVFGLDSNLIQIGLFSKYCIGIDCPDELNSEQKYIDFLLDIGEKLNEKGVLIPTEDLRSLTILKNRRKLEKYYRFTMAELEISHKLINKSIFYKTLEKYGISHPNTYFPNDVPEALKLGKYINYPCYIKPAYSPYFKQDFKTKMFIAESCEELIYLYKKAISKNHDVILQEYIPGKTTNTYGLNAYFDRKFEPKGVFIYRRIREWPNRRGCGCLVEKTTCSDLMEIVFPLIKKIKYYGIIDAEFKLDPRDDKFKLIEINARPWMQIGLSARCGEDLGYLAYMDAIGKEVNNGVQKTNYTKWILVWDDLLASITEMIKNELSFQKWIDSLKGKKEYAYYARDDPLPFFVLSAKSVFTMIPDIFNNLRLM